MPASAYPFHQKIPGPSRLLSMCVSPPEVILGSRADEQTYCHLLCGLKNSATIDGIRAPYAATLVKALCTLKSKWKQLCVDIENGSVSPEITDMVMRDAVNNFLGAPSPDLASGIRDVCSRGDWCGILRELWPELRYVACVTTGSMEHYHPILKHYAGESVPLVCGDYFASECPIGINMDRSLPPWQTSFVILPTAAYFEFLPFELGSPFDANETVDLSRVETGKMYEVVVTTYRGLYRDRLGDVVKVVGFHNLSPKVEFVTRAPKGDLDILTERDLMLAVGGSKQLLRDAKQEVVDCDILNEKSEELIDVLRSCCSFLEDCLDSVYTMNRESGKLGPVEISVVRPGSSDGIARIALENGAPFNQYKPLKIIRNHSLVDLLQASVVVTVTFGGH